MQDKKELSYFGLKLGSFLNDHFPELANDTAFVDARADEALTAYADAITSGSTHLQADEIATETLFRGLHFSRYDTLVTILENEFSDTLPEPLPEQLALLLMRNKAIQKTFGKYSLSEDFVDSKEYDLLYIELTGAIVTLIEKNDLPTVKT